jgi:hypothetical protein
MRFLYMGFSQNSNTRQYRFQGVPPRDRVTRTAPNAEVTLTADLALLARFRVLVQDGPALCLQILSTAHAGLEGTDPPFASHAITPDDLTAFTADRDAHEAARAARRKARPAFKPSASSQLRWPQVR